MARYRKVDPRIWNDRKFRGLSDPGKLAFLFLLTHPHMTAIGAMRGTMPGLAEEIGWEAEAFREAFREALSKGMAEHDRTACLIALPNFLKYNRPESPNVVRAWESALDLLPECDLKIVVIQRAKAFAEALSEAFGKALPEAFAEALPKAMPYQEQEQEQEQNISVGESTAHTTISQGDEDREPVCGEKPNVQAAILLRKRGLRITPNHPDLTAAIGEGVSPETLDEIAEAYPGKPAAYVIAAARRQHAEGPRTTPTGGTHGNADRGAGRHLSLAEQSRLASEERRRHEAG